MKAIYIRTAFISMSALFVAESSFALPSFLDAWQDKYQNSNSDDIGCQLCHSSPAGGQPWNAYGANIRNVLAALNALGGSPSSQDLDEAIENSELRNVDGDPSGGTVIDEINNHFQPGWTLGNNNVTFVENSSDPTRLDPIDNQPPPLFSLNSTKLDPAIPSQNLLPAIPTGSIAVGLQTVAEQFTSPVMAARAPGIHGHLFVVQQDGKIWKVNLSTGSKVLFHDVDAAPGVPLVFAGERGLLGLAFDPDYANNGYFYTYQSEDITGSADFSTLTNPNHQSVISEWQTSDPGSVTNFSVSNIRRVLMRIDQPQANHNGGMLNFGPDGLLYVSTGDGGGSDDQGNGHGDQGNARDNTNPLGAILRLNPRGSDSNNGRYGIPDDNPFINDQGLNEIYAYGFRNPYRFSFDSVCFQSGQTCNTLMLGDVGQSEVEELNRVVRGGNYGWNWKEGSFFVYQPISSFYGNARYISSDSPPNVADDLIDPIAEYKSNLINGRSVIGGYIYRGAAITSLVGRYVFADYFNQLYYLDQDNQISRFQASNIGNISGFGEDHDNELYVVTQDGTNGKLQRIVESEPSDEFCVPIKAVNGAVAIICL